MRLVRGLSAVCLLGATVLTACGGTDDEAAACEPAFGTWTVGTWPSGCWRPYSEQSPFNIPIPANPTLHPDSAAIVDYLSSSFTGPDDLAWADTAVAPEDDYWHPTYYPGPDDPLFTLNCTQFGGSCHIDGLQVRIPDAARPAGGTDAHLTVVDQESGWEWDMWAVTSKPAGGGQLDLGWGGRTRIDGDGLGGEAVSAGYGNLAGIIRAQEMEAGAINHALFMAIGCTAVAWLWPAEQAALTCESQGKPDAHAVPNGARLWLDMSDDEIAALAAPAPKMTILTAMAHYGMFVGDTSGGTSWGIEAESGATYTSFGYPDRLVQFAQANGQAAGQWYSFELANGVDWSRLRVIDPCVSQGSCP